MRKKFKLFLRWILLTELRNILIDNRYKTILGPERSECSSCSVLMNWSVWGVTHHENVGNKNKITWRSAKDNSLKFCINRKCMCCWSLCKDDHSWREPKIIITDLTRVTEHWPLQTSTVSNCTQNLSAHWETSPLMIIFYLTGSLIDINNIPWVPQDYGPFMGHDKRGTFVLG